MMLYGDGLPIIPPSPPPWFTTRLAVAVTQSTQQAIRPGPGRPDGFSAIVVCDERVKVICTQAWPVARLPELQVIRCAGRQANALGAVSLSGGRAGRRRQVIVAVAPLPLRVACPSPMM
jgi:hypothetical protein